MAITEKAVKGIIRKKIADWMQYIADPVLREDVSQAIIVTGGCIPSLLREEPVNDYDVYLDDQAVLIRLMKYYLQQFAANPPSKFKSGEKVRMYVDTKKSYPRCVIKSQGAASEVVEEQPAYEYFETVPAESPATEDFVASVARGLKTELMDMGADSVNSENKALVDLVQAAVGDEFAPKSTGPGAAALNKYRPVFISTNAITLSDSIQIVTRFSGTPEEVHKNFDFVHCTSYYTHGDNTMVLPAPALVAILTKDLRYIGSLYPICSLIRMRKFVKRGWNYNAGQVVKAAYQISKLDLDDIEVLEEQLTGVDAAYFHQIIEILKKGKVAGKTIDMAYVIEVIDAMF